MEETALGDKYLFSLAISVPANQSLSLLYLTPNIIKNKYSFKGFSSCSALCNLLGNFLSPEVAVTARLCTDGDLWADKTSHQLEPSSGKSQIHPSISWDAAEANTEAPLCTGSLAEEKGGCISLTSKTAMPTTEEKGLSFFFQGWECCFRFHAMQTAIITCSESCSPHNGKLLMGSDGKI